MRQTSTASPLRFYKSDYNTHNSSLRNIETRSKSKDIGGAIVVNRSLHNKRRILKSHSGARQFTSINQSAYCDSPSTKRMSKEEIRQTERKRIQNNRPLINYFKEQLDMRYTTREPESSKAIPTKPSNVNYSFGFWEGKPSHNDSITSWRSSMKESAILQRQEESIFTIYHKRQASLMSQNESENKNLNPEKSKPRIRTQSIEEIEKNRREIIRDMMTKPKSTFQMLKEKLRVGANNKFNLRRLVSLHRAQIKTMSKNSNKSIFEGSIQEYVTQKKKALLNRGPIGNCHLSALCLSNKQKKKMKKHLFSLFELNPNKL